MPSRAELRRSGEWVLRATLFAVLAVALWRSWRPDADVPVMRRANASSLARATHEVLTKPNITALDVTLDAMPSRSERDLLTALAHAHVAIHWHGAAPPLAVEVVRSREPEARTRLLVAGGLAAPVALIDAAGLLDSVRAPTGASSETPSVVGIVRAELGTFAARRVAPPRMSSRAVLVLGRPNWETKFVVQALHEAGWVVRVRIPVAPGVFVRDDAILPLDTARYDVVVALDSTASDVTAQITRFVAQGGGFVAAAGALADARLAALAPARAGARRPGRILLSDDSVTTRDLPVRPLVVSRTDAVALVREPAGVVVAARRAGLGRVLLVGYDESWRWRMLGGMSGLPAHRRWWSQAVGSVAPEREDDVRGTSADAAPLAALTASLGPRSVSPPGSGDDSRDPLPLWLFVLAAAALLAETASRRFRAER